MKININLSNKIINRTQNIFENFNYGLLILFLASCLAVIASFYSYSHHLIIAYGDAESHLDIAKRVISGLTPGFAQLGGIWLPVPHLMLVPFVFSNFLWRTGLAGSIVSGFCFVISAFYIYKITHYITKNKYGGFIAAFVFMTNMNALYMQTTPMTELPLILFLVLSTYYFIIYLREDTFQSLIMAALWGLAGSLSRYDGWFLVLVEAFIIFMKNFPFNNFIGNIKKRGIGLFSFITEKAEGELFLYSTLAFIGILGWLLWDGIILGDPLYFTNSQFSAKSQQQGFLQRGMLQAFHNMPLSFLYYFATSMETVGILIFAMAIISLIIFVLDRKLKDRIYLVLLLIVPFIFNVVTLYLGQSILFIPSVTPASFEWKLFNVRYGMMMIPAVAILIGYLFARSKSVGRIIISGLFLVSLGLFAVGYTKIITLDDGLVGLSHSVHPDAETFLKKHYDNGLVLMDDYSRTISVIGTNIPMQDFVYIGTKPYWDNALKAPQDVVRWVVMQKNDALYTTLYDNQTNLLNLYKYFHKVYTSDNILIWERDF
jgi:hypothetical protein